MPKTEGMKKLTCSGKKRILLLFWSVLLPLSACTTESEEARFGRFRDSLADAAVTVEAEVTARDGDAVTAFTLRCAETPDGCDLEVLAPAEIAGVRAHVDASGAEMAFDDVILPMPQAKDTVSPLLALPTVLEAARSGHLDLVWEENGLICQLVPDDDIAVRLTLKDDNTPAAAEVAFNGHTCVFCTITSWSTEERDIHESNDTDVGGNPP